MPRQLSDTLFSTEKPMRTSKTTILAAALCAGEPLVACVRADNVPDGAEKGCTAEKIAAWNKRTAAGAKLPAAGQC